MKRAIALIVSLAIMLSAFSILAFAQTPNCATHDPYLLLSLGWGVEKDVFVRQHYELMDNTKHLIKTIQVIRCATCGEVLTEIIRNLEEEYHVYVGTNKCVWCGYQIQTSTQNTNNYPNAGGSRYDDWPGMETVTKCTNCGSTSHTAGNCPNASSSRYDDWPGMETVTKCTNCGDTNHTAENCPYCEYCRMNTAYGHANNCPNASSSRYDDWPGSETVCQHASVSQEKTNGYYQQTNETYHTYSYTVKNICNYCSKVIATSSGSERQQHSYNNNVCSQCGYRKTCSHSNVTSKTTDEWYKDTSSTYHIYYYTIVTTCKDCGVQVGSQQYNTQEKHSYKNSKCQKCGHEKTCEHKDTDDVLVDTDYEKYSSSKHIKVKYYEEVCNDCNKVVDTYTKETKASHSYNSNYTCKYCGYHKNDVYVPTTPSYTTDYEVVLKVGSTKAYVDGSKVTLASEVKNISSTTYIPAKAISQALGGYRNNWDANTSSASFTVGQDMFWLYANSTFYYLNGMSGQFSKEVKIQNDTMYVAAKDYFGMFGKTVNYFGGYCVIVDDWLTEAEIKTVITKYYDEDYEEEYKEEDVEQTTSEYYDEMKSGKLYAVSSSGEIYRRLLDSTSDIGYTDRYVYTPKTDYSSVSLPKGELLIEKGNYLYDTNGKKICAKISIMLTCDKEIANLIDVVKSGVENAYDAGVITSSRRKSIINEIDSKVSDYKAVKKGSKTLSSISNGDYLAQIGDSNEEVADAQEKLVELGYTSQSKTGEYDKVTQNNILYFQITNDLSVTGMLDQETYDALMASSDNVQEEIEEVQQTINTLTLSQTDIEKGVKIVTIGFNQYYDCTEVLNKVFNDAANQAIKHKIQSPQNMTYLLDYMTAEEDGLDFVYNLFGDSVDFDDLVKIYLSKDDAINLVWFGSKVYKGMAWDIKEEDVWKVTVGTSWPGRNKHVVFYGALYTTSDLGNLLYAYAGAAMGIPEEVLCFAGGFIVHYWKAIEIGPPYYGDDAIDTLMIKEGFNWYNRQH